MIYDFVEAILYLTKVIIEPNFVCLIRDNVEYSCTVYIGVTREGGQPIAPPPTPKNECV